MREIRQSGSEGGAITSRPYPYRVPKERPVGYAVIGFTNKMGVDQTELVGASAHPPLVHCITYNHSAAAGQLAVFQGANDEHI
jgi:hypothetical protein